MPQIKSAIKRVKVTKVKTDNNRSAKTAMRTVVKKFENGVAEGKADVAMLNVTASAIDKAASKGVIHKNAANRKKARLPSVWPRPLNNFSAWLPSNAFR